MAVYTDISDEDLAALLSAWDLGAPRAFKGIAEGVENSNFLLETERGRYFLTIFEKRVARADLPFFMGVMETLANAGFPAPRPIRTTAGDLLGEVHGKACAIVSYLTGLSPRKPNAPQCRAIGAALAEMHAALAGFAMTRANALSIGAWRPLIAPRRDLAERLRPGLMAEIEADLAALDAVWPRHLPRGVIHADLFPDNAFLLGDRVVGVFDFYFACTDALAYDLAVCLNAWCSEEHRSFNLTKGRALIAGYESVRPLTPGERAALATLARGAAMRFFATRLADWAETPDGAMVKRKDPLEYADRLAFHRRATSAGDYGAP
jgi:homoserine kinase type II